MSLFSSRLDVATLRPNPSFAACLDPCQHLLKDGGRDFFGWHMTLIVGAVREKIFLEEPMRAALALLIPLGALVNLLACKVSSPRFICEHANFSVWEFVFHQKVSLVVSLAFLLVAFVLVSISAFASIYWPRHFW
jgi:hypothetical protein